MPPRRRNRRSSSESAARTPGLGIQPGVSSWEEMNVTSDTIAAIATAPGPAGLAVVRISGPDALAVADDVFRGASSLVAVASHSLHHGWAVWPRSIPEPTPEPRGAGLGRAPDRDSLEEPRLDEVVAAVFRAPRSYTREDVVELSCHGGEVCARRVLEALLVAGARAAGPGEFTLRA